MNFKDHFSQDSSEYRLYRPNYPDELFEYLAGITRARTVAWDVATGTGQSAIRLADYFEQVYATDASPQQIDNAVPHQKITYSVAAETCDLLADHSIELVTVAQALHWLDIECFFNEVHRVIANGGVLAVWTYNLLKINEDVDRIVHDLYFGPIHEYWPPERRLVENAYRDITLPFNEIKPPQFTMKANWKLPDLAGYLETWSAVKRYEAEYSENPVEKIHARLARAWGGENKSHTVEWPLTLRVGINS